MLSRKCYRIIKIEPTIHYIFNVSDEFSAKHNKIGMQFQNTNSVKLAVIDALIKHMASQKAYSVLCSVKHEAI